MQKQLQSEKAKKAGEAEAGRAEIEKLNGPITVPKTRKPKNSAGRSAGRSARHLAGRSAGRSAGRPAGRPSAARVSSAAPKKKSFDRGGPVWPPRSNLTNDRVRGESAGALAPQPKTRGSGGQRPPAKNILKKPENEKTRK